MAKKPKPFATEVDLCAAFIATLPTGWTPYAETAGWDILLVRNTDGFQIGVQAKLQCNAHVLLQALEGSYWYHADRPGPDCRAVLVPAGEDKLTTLAAFVGITVISFTEQGGSFRARRSFWPHLPGRQYSEREWHEWTPAKRHDLPEYVPDVAAGAAAPVQLTHWKIQALRLCVTLELRGYVTRADFRHLQLDHRRWISKGGWLSPTPQGWVANELAPGLKAQHPKVYAEIAADAAKWMLKLPPARPEPEQLALKAEAA